MQRAYVSSQQSQTGGRSLLSLLTSNMQYLDQVASLWTTHHQHSTGWADAAVHGDSIKQEQSGALMLQACCA